MSKKEEERLVTLPYCMNCKGICFEYTQSETIYATATYRYDHAGYDELVDTDKHDGEVGDKFCPECGNELLGEEITISLDLFELMHKSVHEKNSNMFLLDFGKDAEGYDISPVDFSVKEAEEKIFEALL